MDAGREEYVQFRKIDQWKLTQNVDQIMICEEGTVYDEYSVQSRGRHT